MAGKSSKGKGKGKGKSESASAASTVGSKELQPLASATGLPELVLRKAPAVPAAVEQLTVEAPKEDVAEALANSPAVETPAVVSEKTEGTDVSEETSVDEKKSNPEEVETRDGSGNGDADGDAELLLYPITVTGPSGEKLELQVNPGDSVMDLRQFLLDAPETCFYTCYDLILDSAEGVRYHLAEYLEIGEVADISAGGCSLEMINALYDDRMVRSHVRRTRDLISTALIHSSLSTALAVDYEAKQAGGAGEEKNTKDKATPKDKAAGSVKTELAELEGGLGFMEDSCGQLSSLVTLPESQEKACVETIAFSSFNPVPGYRRLLGDLIYLDVVTAEGKSFCITAHTRGFYVNSSKGNILNAEPVTPAIESTTLVGLLRLLSKKFVSGFAEILNKKSAGHSFENVPVLLPPNAWLGPHPTPAHKRDIARAEDALMVPYGTEVVGMQRDWNEELQSCREFSRDNLQDRIMRDRALYKVNCDFVEAATKGAKAVINRCIPPINPTDPDRFHMYVHNNIFFSFAVDGDFSLMQQMRDQNPQTDETATEKPSTSNGDVKLNNAETNEGDASLNGDANSAAAVVESEQATYASANNDLKGTKAYNNADVSGLYTLAMAIIDYRGHRVVAQSIIPGILQGDKTESLLYGSVDNGKKIAWNEKFHAKALEAGKLLHIKEHTMLDGAGKAVAMCAPVECKGIVGSDDRHYLLDLMRITPRDINYTGPGSRLCVLRPELVAMFCQVEAQERVKESKTDEQADEKALVQEELSKIMLNPNVFTDFKLAGSQEEIEADEELVRKAGNYLKDTVLPRLVADLSSLEVSPMDGPTLTDALHAHGINIRYLGQVAKKAEHLPHVWDLTVVEMVVRAAKHVLKGVLRETLDQDVGGAIAHFFDCLVGPESAKPVVEGSAEPSGKSETKTTSGKASSTESASSEPKPSYLCITPDLVWSDIEESVKFKYQFDLPSDIRSRVRKISTFRNLSQKMGVMLAARKYEFQADAPFKTSDILDLQSVVKHLSPVCVDARDLLESGKLCLAQGKLNEAYEAFSEAFTILQQVCGPMHREVANCCRYLAMVLYHAGDMAGAIMQQHKELIINERCLGGDHPDTAHSYGNMALFYHGLNQTELALRHMARTLLLLNVSCGSDHPDVAATFINIAMMYQDIGKMNVALRYLQEALKRNERLLGEEHIQTAVCYHALAIAFNCMGAYKLSLQHERSTYNILVKQLGEEDSRTKDSANWIKTFQIRDIQANAQKQRGQQAVSAASAQKAAADALKARPDLVQAFQQAAASSSVNRGPTGTSPQSQPRARGAPDERAARAVNEVRKKAAARGLQVRPQAAAPNQSIPPLGDLLSLINSGVAGKAPLASSTPSSSTPRGTAKAAQTGGKKAATTAAAPKSVPVSAVGNGPVQATAAAAADVSGPSPIGLGNGLGGLESKKKKSKSKNAA